MKTYKKMALGLAFGAFLAFAPLSALAATESITDLQTRLINLLLAKIAALEERIDAMNEEIEAISVSDDDEVAPIEEVVPDPVPETQKPKPVIPRFPKLESTNA